MAAQTLCDSRGEKQENRLTVPGSGKEGQQGGHFSGRRRAGTERSRSRKGERRDSEVKENWQNSGLPVCEGESTRRDSPEG